jgi:hypothetical protein
MITSPTKDGIVDVPAQVFENFLEALRDAGASPELIARLRKALLEDKIFAEHALKAAVFGEEPLL